MLSISKAFKGSGTADYYLNLAREDYYINGQEPPGFWFGQGAPASGLEGKVQADDFRNTLSGYSPDGATRRVHNAGSANRRSGWDLTWSVPKSVSVAWSQASPEIRAVIESEVRGAVKRALAYIESLGVVSRRGTDGVVREQARLLFACFEHSTSRALDPQLHIHTILINCGIRPDGTTGTLEPKTLYRHQLAAGALFRAELAARLERTLGLRARRNERTFELLGVPTVLMDEFSKRRAQIVRRLEELGVNTPQAAEKAALDTRAAKLDYCREDLFRQWSTVGQAHHWGAKDLGWLIHAPFPARDRERENESALAGATKALTFHDSHFSSRRIVQAVAEEAQGRGLDADQVLGLYEKILHSPELVALVPKRDEARWTTQEMLKVEKQALNLASGMRSRERRRSDGARMIGRALREFTHLTREQRLALRSVTQHESGIRLISGMAGTGKSTLFKAAAQIWSLQGRQVVGACLAGKAALELSQATGIASQTLHRTLKQLEAGQLELGSNSVLLIDEAAMVGTRGMKTILEHCTRSGASLVLCGDAAQLQSIEAGGMFAELTRRLGADNLTEIKRQREEWARQAVVEFAQGDSATALQRYSDRGLVRLADSPHTAMRALVADLDKSGQGATTVVLANRNSDVNELNELVQEERFRHGFIKGAGLTVGSTTFFEGDRVLFTRNEPGAGVFNGQLATVRLLKPRHISVEFDTGRMLTIDPETYPFLRLGYALTTCKAQGMTSERCLIYVDEESLDREATYVQASRARGESRFYAVSEGLPGIAEKMAVSRPKVMAQSVLPEPGPQLSLVMTL